MECEDDYLEEEEELEDEEDLEEDEDDFLTYDYIKKVRRGPNNTFEIEISAIDEPTIILRLSKREIYKLIREIIKAMTKDEIIGLLSTSED